MSEPAKVNYALAIDSAVVYVALALDKAAPAALSVEELAKGYRHPVPADLTRIKLHEKLNGDIEATQWLIRRAIAHLGKGVESVDGLAIIANGHHFEDLQFRGHKLTRPGPDPHAMLRDPFNPMTGVFSDNIRRELKDSKDPAYDELRESLKTHGWVPEFPAITDERGVVLVGHRRLAIARDLGIEPINKILEIGSGDAADARRLSIALASNTGAKKLSPNDRKFIATYLYQDHNWTMQSIADALNVAKSTVSEDLSNCSTVEQFGKPKRGRPKKGKGFKNRVERRSKSTADLDEKLFPLLESGMSHMKIVDELGVGERAVQDAQQRYIGQTRAQPSIIAEETTGPQKCTCPNCGNIHEKA